jgi:hypothetical protein
MITPAQDRAYWREWSKAKKQLRAYGFDDDEIETRRRDLTREVTNGRSDSHKEIRRVGEFTEWLSAVAAIHSPDDLDRQLELIRNPEKIRAYLVAQILAFGLPEGYLESMACDLAGSENWQHLPEDRLRWFRNTARDRARSLARKS